MRLKGKLFTIFGSVMLFSLVVLGVIIHYSFTENTIQSQEEILRLKIDNLSLRTHAALQAHSDPILQALLPYLDNGQIKEQHLAAASGAVRQILEAERLIKAVSIAQSQSNKVIIQAGPQVDGGYAVLPEGLRPSTDVFVLVAVDDKLFLSGRPFSAGVPLDVTLELDRHEFGTLLHSLFDVEQTILFLVDDKNNPLVTIDHAPDLTCSHFDAKVAGACQHGINSIHNNDGYLYRHKEDFCGQHVYLLVSESYFFKELNSLKNRIITGIVVVGWLLIWVILIFAHKITSPIRKLSEITHDLVVLDYDTELTPPASSDEISELYQNFEIMRRKLKDLIITDPLTNVYNRRFLMHVFEVAVLKAVRMEQELSCIMLDIDFFKEVNDRYGHQCGDTVLKEIGRIMQQTIRPYDTPARYGGEEFILLLPETDQKQAHAIAERLRLAIAGWEMTCGDETFQCTVSLGVAGLVLREAESAAAIMANVDCALYEAKRKGRNQTIVFKKGMSFCQECRVVAAET